MEKAVSRRWFLRGAGVALSLPWFESLLPRSARAQAVSAPVRYMPIFLPCGAADRWRPPSAGVGAAWSLGPVLEPFAELKSKVTVLSDLENGSVFNASGSSEVEPSHGKQPGAWLTCMDAAEVKKRLGVAEANGVSVDQIMAAHAVFAGKTRLPSLQVGLSTVYSYCDGAQCSNSRSVSWKTPTQPMYKMVDPLQLFNAIVGDTQTGANGGAGDVEAQKRLALKKSVLDTVLGNATATRARLGSNDQRRLDEFLDAVRTTEKQATVVSTGMTASGCQAVTAPTMAKVTPDGIRQNTGTYNKGAHFDAMNALIVMAMQCDVTRIVSYMLEDERSEFTYDHVQKRTFTATGSTLANGTCAEYHTGGQHGSQDDFASLSRWNASKVFELCKQMDAVKEGNGFSLLDNTVVFFGGAMHGSNHACNKLPTMLIGGAGGKLKTDQHVELGNRPLRDLHYTLMNAVFGMGVTEFGQNLTGAPLAPIQEIIAV
jgi:hypothetical protein